MGERLGQVAASLLVSVIVLCNTTSWSEVSNCTVYAVVGSSSFASVLLWIAVRCLVSFGVTRGGVRPQFRDCDEMVLYDPS